MNYKRVKKIDHDFSVLGFGCWGASGNGSWTDHSDEAQIKAIQTAIELGVNFFDVAPIYGLGHAETVLGKAIKGKRNDIFIASKAGLPWTETYDVRNDVTKESILKEIDDSLSRLGVDYVDLYQVHWPTDCGTPLEETVEALIKVKETGKARYVGLTNFSADDYFKANQMTDIVSMQGLYNMLEQNAETYHNIPLQYRSEKEIFPLCKEEGLAFFPYSPMFQGLLTGKIQADTCFDKNDVRNANPKLHGDERMKYLEKLDEIRNLDGLKDKPLYAIALNYLVAKEQVTSVISSQANEDEVRKNVAALSWTIDKDLMQKIDAIALS